MAKKRGGLGRGIGALIPSAAPAQAAPATTPAKAEASTAPAQTPEVSASEPTPSANKTSATQKKPAQKASAPKSTTAKSATAKSSAQKSPAKKAPAKKTSTQKASTQEASTQQAPAPKASAKKTPATKASTTQKPGTQASSKRTASSKPAASSSSTSRASASTATNAGTAPSQDAAPEARPAKTSTTRPVDMFFSAESSTGAQSSRARTHLADDWARDTQSKRRTATKKPRRSSAAKAGTSTKEFDSAVEVEAAQPVDVTDTVEAPVTDLSDTNAAAAIDDPTQPSAPTTDESTAGEDFSAAAEETAEAEAPAPEASSAAESDASPSEEADGDRASTEAPQTTGSAARSRDDSDDEDFEGQELLTVPGAQFAEVPINEIRENPRNPRTVFDDDELNELAYSLQEVGVLQPIVIRPITGSENGESFELVMGERRWRAAKRAGLTSIPAIIRDTTDDDLLRDALLENLHRTQLNPLEEAAAYGQLLEDFGCTQDELSDKIGRSRPQISNTLRLLRLPPLVQRRLASGAISAGHARALLGLDDAQLQEELAQRIVNEGLSVRAVERLIANGVSPSSGVRSAAPRRTSYNPHVVDMTSKLSNRLETPVRIDVGKRKGKITVEFTNLDDLDRLMERLGLDVE